MKSFISFLLFIFLYCDNAIAETDFLRIQCLANYRDLLSPVEEVELRDGIENSKIKIPGLSEYHDILPQSCSHELGQGELKVVELNHKLFTFNLVLYNSAPVILKNFSPLKSAMIEVGIKRYKQGSQIIRTSLSNDAFQYTVSKINDKKYVEYLTFRSLASAYYE